MGMAPRYDVAAIERRLQAIWSQQRIYAFAPDDPRPIFAIDTPPPTVSGAIHIGHVYSYVQAEAMIRYWRMQGYNVYYPFGFDDNGLPTERFVEQQRGVRARDLGRAAFIEACLEVSSEVEDRFEAFWKRLGMSVDWRLRYSTIDPDARRVPQWSFLDLYAQGRVYRAQTPSPWCTECRTAIAQAEIDDLTRPTVFFTLAFATAPGSEPTRMIPIATTRPELLPACTAVMVHPDDARYHDLIGQQAQIPLLDRYVPILADAAVDPTKGSGVVMCCTFGDATDVAWWRTYDLPLIALVTHDGCLSEAGGAYAGLTLAQARSHILADLRAAGLLLDERPAEQTIRVHERCGTPLELIESRQWFVRILDLKEALLELGRRITWQPAFLQARYEHWVQNLNQDWCISRQRFFGVPFPAWHCPDCGAVLLADAAQLPVDPLTATPPRACGCGQTMLLPDEDVMDTWATSSVSPWIAALRLGRVLGAAPVAVPTDDAWARRLLPMQLRPQAHDIIRTWAFYTIVKAYLHTGTIPWETLAISGHALGPDGRKISKSKNHATVQPEALIERYGADAVRYWACSGALGSDQPVNEQAMRQGGRLITKLWNAARLIEAGRARALAAPSEAAALWPLDRALLSWLHDLIERADAEYRAYRYAAALDLVERFFWGTFCDAYLEMVKDRLYDGTPAAHTAALTTLETALLAILRLLAPIMPHVTEAIYQELFAQHPNDSIHTSGWPVPNDTWRDQQAEQTGMALVAIAGVVRRWKSAHQRSIGSPLAALTIAAADPALRTELERSASDIASVSRAQHLRFVAETPGDQVIAGVWVAVSAD